MTTHTGPLFDPWLCWQAHQQTGLASIDPLGTGRWLRERRLDQLLSHALCESPVYARRAGNARVLDVYKRQVVLFGPEPTGLAAEVLADERVTARVRIPMLPGRRSMNLSNAAAVVVYEAWRQQGYAGGRRFGAS